MCLPICSLSHLLSSVLLFNQVNRGKYGDFTKLINSGLIIKNELNSFSTFSMCSDRQTPPAAQLEGRRGQVHQWGRSAQGVGGSHQQKQARQTEEVRHPYSFKFTYFKE